MSDIVITTLITAIVTLIISVIVNVPGWVGLRDIRKKNKSEQDQKDAESAEIINRISISLITPLEKKVNRLLRNQTQLRSDLSRMVSIARHFLVGLYRMSAQLHANNIVPDFTIDPAIEKEMLAIEINASHMADEEVEIAHPKIEDKSE